MDLTQDTPDREQLILFDAKYKRESEGHKVDMPVIHLFARNAHGEPRHVEVSGFRPIFFIDFSTFAEHHTDILNDRRVLGVEIDLTGATDDERDVWNEYVPSIVDEDESTETDVWRPERIVEHLSRVHTASVYDTETFDQLGSAVDPSESLVKIIAKMPKGVGGGKNKKGLRNAIQDNWNERTWEADIPFERRFLISTGIHRGFTVPDAFDENNRIRVRQENWDGASDSNGRVQELEPADAPKYTMDACRAHDGIKGLRGHDVRPRVLTVDIEVATHGGGVPDPVRARNEITAITAHDSYDDVYKGWFLRSDEWRDLSSRGWDEMFEEATQDELGIESDISVWEDETSMLDNFNLWVTERRFDLITGWNSSKFDYPYLIQRSYEINSWEITNWDQLGNPGVWKDKEDGDRDVNFKVDGMVLWDMLDGYKKTLFRDVSSYRLDDVAQEELDYGKAPIGDIDEAWHHDPVNFAVYNTRDVEAVVEIEKESSLLDLYEHMREVTGANLVDCHTNGPMIDTLFLRHAFNRGIALPTNVEPDVGDFHGALVFNPRPGIHRNVIYPDLSSLYPYLIWTLNVSPEMYIHGRGELERSLYTEEDVFTVYVDKREFTTIPKGQEIGNVDKDKYKGVLDGSGDLRDPPGLFEPRYDEAFMVKPTVEEGFIRETVDELVDMKYEYKGEGVIYDAVKRVTNSVWGVLGDSASMGRGFRLFDWRLGEVITLGGRKVIEYTAEEYVRLVNEFAVEDGFEPKSYLVGGDTDSCQSSVPMAPDFNTALQWAHRASEEFLGTPSDPGLYDRFMEEEFGVMIGKDEHRMDVEIESLASKMFFKKDFDNSKRGDDVATKKRYVEHEIWEDSHGWIDTPDADEYDNAPDDPDDLSQVKYLSSVDFNDYISGPLQDQDNEDNISVTGFEYVRSDIAPVTAEAQMEVFKNLLLTDEYQDPIYSYLEELVQEVHAGEISLGWIGRTAGIGQNLDDYGWKDYEELKADKNYTVTDVDKRHGGRYVSTPGPAYRGLKYAVDHFPWQDETKKAVRIYIEDVRAGEYPETYQYDTFPRDEKRPDPPEVGRPVDAIALDEPDRLPEQFVPDYDLMLEKEVRDNVQGILQTVGMDWDFFESNKGEGRQTGLSQFG